jgi:hypothetical protein
LIRYEGSFFVLSGLIHLARARVPARANGGAESRTAGNLYGGKPERRDTGTAENLNSGKPVQRDTGTAENLNSGTPEQRKT